MKIGPTFRIAARALRRNKMRSILTMLGIIIGVGAVIAMVGIGNGARAQVEGQIASLGENMILIFSGSSSSSGVRSGWGGAGTLTVDDALAIGRELPSIRAVSPEVRDGTQVAAGNQNWFTSLLGQSADYFDMRQWAFESGTGFTEQDVRTAAKVAVIGRTTSQQLFGDADPVGQTFRTKGVPFTIVGLLSSKGTSLLGSDQDDTIVVPYTTAMKRLTGADRIRAINVQARSAEELNAAQEQITALLRQRHNIGPGRDDDFTVRTQNEISEMATSTSRVMTMLLGAIASVSLLVGGIGIMNIMLVSVTERTREIGIRMAVGAHGSDIMLQFLIEAITLSCLGGLIGIILGYGTAEALSHFAGWPTFVSTTAVLTAFGFSAAVGIFFGLYPARKAAALDPIDALRYE
jgi:putative ABC transport system permease protein